VLPADARLPGAGAARVADAQAKGDPPGPGPAAPGGPGGRLERPPGEPAAAIVTAMAADPPLHAQGQLDAAAAEDDAQGDALSRRPRAARHPGSRLADADRAGDRQPRRGAKTGDARRRPGAAPARC